MAEQGKACAFQPLADMISEGLTMWVGIENSRYSIQILRRRRFDDAGVAGDSRTDTGMRTARARTGGDRADFCSFAVARPDLGDAAEARARRFFPDLADHPRLAAGTVQPFRRFRK